MLTPETVEAVLRSARNGHFFSVHFIKLDGSLRKMNCRLGVHKYLRGGDKTTDANPDLVTVFDNHKKQYRCFDKNRVVAMQVKGVRYAI